MIGTAITSMIMLLSLCRIVIVIIDVWNEQEKHWKTITIFAVSEFPDFDLIAINNNWTYHMLEIMKSPEE